MGTLYSFVCFSFLRDVRQSRRGRGGVVRGGGPCGCPPWPCCLLHILATPPQRAATRAPTPHPLLSRPYANEPLRPPYKFQIITTSNPARAIAPSANNRLAMRSHLTLC